MECPPHPPRWGEGIWKAVTHRPLFSSEDALSTVGVQSVAVSLKQSVHTGCWIDTYLLWLRYLNFLVLHSLWVSINKAILNRQKKNVIKWEGHLDHQRFCVLDWAYSPTCIMLVKSFHLSSFSFLMSTWHIEDVL